MLYFPRVGFLCYIYVFYFCVIFSVFNFNDIFLYCIFEYEIFVLCFCVVFSCCILVLYFRLIFFELYFFVCGILVLYFCVIFFVLYFPWYIVCQINFLLYCTYVDFLSFSLLCCIIPTLYFFNFFFSACLKIFLIWLKFSFFWNDYYGM